MQNNVNGTAEIIITKMILEIFPFSTNNGQFELKDATVLNISLDENALIFDR